MPIEASIAKALLGPAMGYAGKKATQALLGRPDERALITLCSDALGAALDEALGPYLPLRDGERDHLLSLLEMALGEAIQAVEGMASFGRADLQTIARRAHESEMLDWTTFGVYRDDRFYKLDEKDVFRKFLTELPERLRNSARHADSPLANLAHQLNYDELVLRLYGIRQALTMSAAVGSAGDADEARRRALERQRSVVAARMAEDLPRTQHIESGLMEQWLTWSTTRPWPDQIVDALLEASTALNGISSEVAQRLEATAATVAGQVGSYSSLRLVLNDAPLDEASAALSKASVPIGGIAVGPESAWQQLLWLKRQADQPRFNYTFNVAGSFGSGTSRFLTKIAQEADKNGDLMLFITAGFGESFTSALQRQLSETLGTNFRDIRDINVVLTDDGRRLYLLVEDVDRQVSNGASLDDLLSLIEASTAVPGIRWCLAGNVDGLDTVFSSSRPYFWRAYGFTPKDKMNASGGALEGWIDLDFLNVRKALGLRLLRELAAGDQPDLQTMLSYPREFASEGTTFANPLPAWMRYETLTAGLTAHPVSDPQNPGFIRQYWSFLKLRHLGVDTTSPTELAHAEVENAVRMLARQFHASGQSFAPLYTPGGVKGETATVNMEAAAALRRMGLLRVSYRGNPEVEPLVVGAVPVFAPFWGYRIGQLILNDLRHSTDQNYAKLAHGLQRWYGPASRGEALAQAVCQFTLGGLAEEGHDRDREIWQNWERDPQAPTVPILMAGAAAPEPFNRIAIKLVTRAHYKPLNGRETFVMMRLAMKVSSSDWKADQRVAILSSQREAITRSGLHSYSSHVTQAVLTMPDLVKRENFVNTCIALMGCEETGTAGIAGRLMAANGLRIFASYEEFARYAIRFFQRISTYTHEHHQSRKPREKRKSKSKQAKQKVLTRPDDDTFPQQFIIAVLDRILGGPDAAETVRTLAKLGWWTGQRQGIHPSIAFHMAQQLNMTFGRTVHRRGPDKEYGRVVEDLISGTLLPHASRRERLTISMYLIKHSVPTFARWDLGVDTCLHPALTQLWDDEEFRNREFARLEPLCRANKIISP